MVRGVQQRSSFFLSICLHVGLVVVAVLWQNFGGVKVNLEVPTYTVDLVNIAPGPPPGPIGPGPAIPAVSPNPAPPTMAPNPEVKPEQTAAAPEPAKPEPVKAEPAKPEPVKAPPPKPEPAKPAAKPEPKPEAKPISETKAESKKPEPKKEAAKPEPSNKDILASALQDVKKEAAKDGGKSSGPSPQQQAKNDVQSELAALRKTVGGSLYSTGGGGGGGGGGSGSSGLLQVYASIVEQAIKKNWRYPVFGNDSNLVAVVEVRIDAKGQIADVKVLTPSDRADFDDSAVKAVRETKELPPPPSEAVGTLRINFNLQELNR